MAKKKRTASGKTCCPPSGACTFWGFMLLFVGLLFLLEDLNYLTLYGVSWWTAAFLLIGMMKITKGLY